MPDAHLNSIISCCSWRFFKFERPHTSHPLGQVSAIWRLSCATAPGPGKRFFGRATGVLAMGLSISVGLNWTGLVFHFVSVLCGLGSSCLFFHGYDHTCPCTVDMSADATLLAVHLCVVTRPMVNFLDGVTNGCSFCASDHKLIVQCNKLRQRAVLQHWEDLQCTHVSQDKNLCSCTLFFIPLQPNTSCSLKLIQLPTLS
jgi:hypothetical protein